MENKYVVKENQSGERLDKAITELDSEISRMAIKRLLEEEKITVNRESRQAII